MGRLVYSAICSLDGYVEDADGGFGWAEPDTEVHQFINDQERPIGTYLLGRRMYETMLYWETVELDDEASEVGRDYAQIWRAAQKVVYSSTLPDVLSERTRMEREFDAAEVAALKEESVGDLSIGGSTIAGQAIRSGLVDELSLYVNPVSVGGGKPALPADFRWNLQLVEQRAFASGVVYLRYLPS